MRPVCVDHMTFPVGDLERSVAFYRAALVEGMGWVECEVEGAPTFGPEGAEDLSLVPGGPLRPTIHLAFAADDFAQVEGFHREGLAAGGRDNGAPARACSTRRATTAASCSTPTATTSRRSGTRRRARAPTLRRLPPHERLARCQPLVATTARPPTSAR